MTNMTSPHCVFLPDLRLGPHLQKESLSKSLVNFEFITPLLFEIIIFKTWTFKCILFSLAKHCKNFESLSPNGSEVCTREGRRGWAIRWLSCCHSSFTHVRCLPCPAPLLPREPAKVLRILLVCTHSGHTFPFILTQDRCLSV